MSPRISSNRGRGRIGRTPSSAGRSARPQGQSRPQGQGRPQGRPQNRPMMGAVPTRPAQEVPAGHYGSKQLIEKRVLTKFPDQRVGIFVDVSNMYWSVRRLGGSLNFKALREEAVGERKLIRALAYAVTSGVSEEEKFFAALAKSGFEVKLKQLQVFAGGKKKADWDVGLAMDMVRLAPLIDVAVLVSGDGDYVPVIEYLQNSGHLVEVMAFKEGVSAKLVERADAFIDMSQDQSRFLIR